MRLTLTTVDLTPFLYDPDPNTTAITGPDATAAFKREVLENLEDCFVKCAGCGVVEAQPCHRLQQCRGGMSLHNSHQSCHVCVQGWLCILQGGRHMHRLTGKWVHLHLTHLCNAPHSWQILFKASLINYCAYYASNRCTPLIWKMCGKRGHFPKDCHPTTNRLPVHQKCTKSAPKLHQEEASLADDLTRTR